MTSTTSEGTSRAGKVRHERRWHVDEPRAAMLIVHGVAEHIGRYEHVGAYFAGHGIDVVGFDLRGHGRSGGKRGFIDSWSDFLDDVEDLLAQRRALDVPVVLYGHSMGGLISTTYAESDRPQPDLLVLSAPALEANLPAWQRALSPIMSKVLPSVSLPNDLDGDLLARNPEVGRVYESDPLRVKTGTPRLGYEAMKAMDGARANLEKIEIPTYVFHGSDDRLVPVTASEGFEHLSNATRRVWGGLRHECHNEPEQVEVLGEVVAWLDEQLAAMPASDSTTGGSTTGDSSADERPSA
jgi:alpha-beta hydrolase superfamily lysophospholipase